jgi:serine/threonine protein kinase
VENTAKVADTMLRALAAAHAAGIVHRDVKPANVMLATDGRVLLTDFGIAHHEGDSSLTMTGAVIGSAEYLAPERARADEAGPAADLFSLGVTLYQAVEGVSPFRRDSPTATMSAVLFEQPAPPKKAGRLTALLGALLAKEPGQRPTVHAALAMLEESAAGGSGANRGGAFAPTPSAPVLPPTRKLPYQATPTPPTPYLAGQTLNAGPPPHPGNGNGSGNGNGLKVVLAVAAVVAISTVGTLGISHLMHSGTPQAGGSSSSTPAPTPTTAPPTSAPTSTPDPTATDSGPTSSDTSDTSDNSGGAKPGCNEASRDLNAYNSLNAAAHGDKDYQIRADRDLAANLTADAAPTVKAAIQSEADSWNTFADDYAKGDVSGMNDTIPKTGKAISAVQKACIV